jgi:ABC-type phosphate transport system substrate-binding protein
MKTMKSKMSQWLLVTVLLWVAMPVFADEMVVIVHPSNPLTEIAVNDVKKIYLGKMKFFPGGNKALPGDQKKGTKSRKFFYGGIIGKSEAKLKSYWSRLIFTGKGTPPKTVGDDHALKTWVAERENAIGYIMRSEVDDTVKVLTLK